MKRVMTVVATTHLGLAATTLYAAPPADDALVQSAIASEFAADPAVLQSRLETSKRRVADAMRVSPDGPLGGVLVFARGFDSKEVGAFADSYRLEVTRAEAKVAARATNITETMSFGSQSLLFLDGPLDERLEKLVGHQRAVFMAVAKNASEASQAAEFREAAYSRDIRFYKIEIVGPASSFDRIQKSGEAAALFVDGSQARVEQLAVAKAEAARMAAGRVVIKGRPYDQGPPRGMVGTPFLFGNEPVAPPDPVTQPPQATPQ